MGVERVKGLGWGGRFEKGDDLIKCGRFTFFKWEGKGNGSGWNDRGGKGSKNGVKFVIEGFVEEEW